MADESEFVKFLEERAESTWRSRKRPYMISSIAVDLASKNMSYKHYLGEEERLKKGVSRLSTKSQFDVVQHPSHRAKTGLVPKGVTFSFEDNDKVIANKRIPQAGPSVNNRERLVLDFILSIGALPDALAREVNVPCYVLAKLLKEK